ncbi:hypothetical protein [Neisseria sicca]|nr:hypothetical protein [Neisseria sicca]
MTIYKSVSRKNVVIKNSTFLVFRRPLTHICPLLPESHGKVNIR